MGKKNRHDDSNSKNGPMNPVTNISHRENERANQNNVKIDYGLLIAIEECKK